MPATFAFYESNGGGESSDVITNLNFGSDDGKDLNTSTYPISAGSNSYSKYIRARFTDSFTEISNMKFWQSAPSGGGYVTGEAIKAQANVVYATPSQDDTGDDDVPLVVGSALAIQSAAGTSTITAPGYSKYLRLQLQSTGSTPSGAVAQKIFTFQYDEI